LLLLLLLPPPLEGAAADARADNIAGGVCRPRCRAEQREALVQLYERLDGPSWRPQGDWAKEGVDHCRCVGVCVGVRCRAAQRESARCAH
jgi:roadblock/LC7 domain-containing protein